METVMKAGEGNWGVEYALGERRVKGAGVYAPSVRGSAGDWSTQRVRQRGERP